MRSREAGRRVLCRRKVYHSANPSWDAMPTGALPQEEVKTLAWIFALQAVYVRTVHRVTRNADQLQRECYYGPGERDKPRPPAAAGTRNRKSGHRHLLQDQDFHVFKASRGSFPNQQVLLKTTTMPTTSLSCGSASSSSPSPPKSTITTTAMIGIRRAASSAVSSSSSSGSAEKP